MYWWDSTRLVIWKDRGIGLWDVARKEEIWLVDGRTCHRWREFVVTSEARGQLSLIDGVTGRVSARIDLGQPLLVTATLCGDIMLCKGWEDEPICAVSLPERRVLWSQSLGLRLDHAYGPEPDARTGVVLTAGSLSDGVIATRYNRTFRIAVADGRPLWKADVPVPYGWPMVIQGLIPVLAGERFVVMDELTGAIRVDRRHADLIVMYRAQSGSLMGDDAVAFASESGHLALLSLTNGDLLWSHKYDVPFLRTAVADGRLLVSAGDGSLWVFAEGTTTTSVTVSEGAGKTPAARPRGRAADPRPRAKVRKSPKRARRSSSWP